MNPDVSTMLMIAGPIVIAVVGAVGLYAGRLSKGEGEAAAAASAAATSMQASKDAHQRLDELNKEFGNFKEHVAREYVSNVAIVQLETRMGEEFRRVRETLDRLFVPVVRKEP